MSIARRLASATPVAGAFLCVVAACRGCSSSDPSPAEAPADASPDAYWEATTDSTTADTHETAPADVPSDVSFDGVPSGWQAWTSWSPKCPIYIPGPGVPMPPPIEWEPCPAPIPAGLACRRMKNTWGGDSSFFPRFWRNPSSGAVLLLFSRMNLGGNPGARLRIVAEADGKVEVGQLQLNADSFDCQYFDEDLADGRYALNLSTRTGPVGADGGASLERGVIGATVGEQAPSIVVRLGDVPSNWQISSDYLAELTYYGIAAWSWSGTQLASVYKAANDPDGLQPHLPVVRGKDVLFGVGDLQLCGVMSWNLQDGLRPLLRWYGDTTHAAGNLGSDGNDMVWTQNSGPNACKTDGPNAEVWTAPHTMDPTALQASAHRVRSDLGGVYADSYTVGNGYAARLVQYGSPASVSVSIIRLSDGYRWIIEGKLGSDPISWGVPLGFSDQEIFMPMGTVDMLNTIARIRLDSLGPGTPPD